jgi:hypothetical protein
MHRDGLLGIQTRNTTCPRHTWRRRHNSIAKQVASSGGVQGNLIHLHFKLNQSVDQHFTRSNFKYRQAYSIIAVADRIERIIDKCMIRLLASFRPWTKSSPLPFQHHSEPTSGRWGHKPVTDHPLLPTFRRNTMSAPLHRHKI